MELSRRQIIRIGTGAVLAAGLTPRAASAAPVAEALDAFAGGTEVVDGGIDLITPEIAENGNTVPIEVSAPGASAIAIFADGNPEAEVAIFSFGPLAGSQSASTRIRLARTQNVIAVALMADGTARRTAREVEVTIGGCGA